MRKPIVILGAGGFAREVADLLAELDTAGDWEVLGFVDRDSSRKGEILNGLPILGGAGDLKPHDGLYAVAGSGDIIPRRRQVTQIEELGLVPAAALIHSHAVVSPSASVGAGAIVCAHTVVTANSRIGGHSVVNYGATVGHDVDMGECCMIGPGAHISGWVSIGDDCYLGTGAMILPKVTLGRGSIVGAGAVVTKDVAAGSTVVGVPARPRASGFA